MQLMTVRTVLRTMANVPGSTLKETRRWIYSKPPRNKIGAAVSLKEKKTKLINKFKDERVSVFFHLLDFIMAFFMLIMFVLK